MWPQLSPEYSQLLFSLAVLARDDGSELGRDDGSELAAEYVRRGVQSLPAGSGVRLKEVVLASDESERSFCHSVLSEDGAPDVMIDVTSKPSILDTRMAPAVSPAVSSAVVKTVSRKFGIPTISTRSSLGMSEPAWQGLSPSEQELFIAVKPPGDTIPAVIKDMVVEHSMSTVAIFHDDTFGEFSTTHYF